MHGLTCKYESNVEHIEREKERGHIGDILTKLYIFWTGAWTLSWERFSTVHQHKTGRPSIESFCIYFPLEMIYLNQLFAWKVAILKFSFDFTSQKHIARKTWIAHPMFLLSHSHQSRWFLGFWRLKLSDEAVLMKNLTFD